MGIWNQNLPCRNPRRRFIHDNLLGPWSLHIPACSEVGRSLPVQPMRGRRRQWGRAHPITSRHVGIHVDGSSLIIRWARRPSPPSSAKWRWMVPRGGAGPSGKGREGKGGQGSPGAVAECWAWLVTERAVVSGCVELCFCVCACACFCPLSLFSLSVSLSVANTKLGECTAAAVAVLELTSPPRPCS